MYRLARLLIVLRLPLLLACLGITAWAYPLSSQLQYDRSVRSMFTQNHPRLQTYLRMEKEFEGDALCLAVYGDPDLLTPQGMRDLHTFAAALRAVPGVKSALSLADMPRPLDPSLVQTMMQRAFGKTSPADAQAPKQFWKELVDWFNASDADIEQLRRECLACEMYVDWFISKDGKTAAVVMQLDLDRMADGNIAGTLTDLRNKAKFDCPKPGVIVGAPAMISDVYTYLDEDAFVLQWVSQLTMVMVIMALFRSLRWMVLPICIVQITLIWTNALMVATNIRLSIIGSMTTALVTVIGIATVIHIAVRFRDEFGKDHDSQAALARTFERLVPAVFWTCATTAGGFAALLVVEVEPIRNFGFVMAVASMLVGVVCFLFLPAGVLLGNLRQAPKDTIGEERLTEGLGAVVHFVARHSWTTTFAMFAVFVVAAVGYARIDVETDFTKNFRATSPILTGYRFAEERLGGAGLLDLTFDVPEKPDVAFFERVRKCEKELRKIDGVVKVAGMSDLLDFFDQAMKAAAQAESQKPAPKGLLHRAGGLFSGGSPASLAANLNPEQLLQLQLRLLPRVREALPMFDMAWNVDAHRMRILLRVREQQGVLGKTEMLKSIQDTAERELGEPADVTGLYVLLVYLIFNILEDQLLTFILASIGMFIMAMIAFRSVRLAVATLVTNVIPIIVVVGAMGWLGIKLNVTTAMIGSISMGLVVDFSIHYLARFRQEWQETGDFYKALDRTHCSTGKAMVFANIALMLGFSVLVLSNFVPTIHFGILVSVAILGGLIGNLVMLPVMLRVAYRMKPPPTDF